MPETPHLAECWLPKISSWNLHAMDKAGSLILFFKFHKYICLLQFKFFNYSMYICAYCVGPHTTAHMSRFEDNSVELFLSFHFYWVLRIKPRSPSLCSRLLYLLSHLANHDIYIIMSAYPWRYFKCFMFKLWKNTKKIKCLIFYLSEYQGNREIKHFCDKLYFYPMGK